MKLPRTGGLTWPHIALGGAMIVASGLSVALTPTRHTVAEGAVDLERIIPKDFAGWRQVETAFIQMDLTPRDGEETTTDQPYDQTLMRTYVRNTGEVVMLALAYGRTQRQEVKVHRPELCYVAQGFEVRRKERSAIALAPGVDVMAYKLITRSQHRVEPVTYWIRIGDRIAANAWESRISIFVSGLVGTIPDGILVRASTPQGTNSDPSAAYPLQTEFLSALFQSLDQQGRSLLVGSPS